MSNINDFLVGFKKLIDDCINNGEVVEKDTPDPVKKERHSINDVRQPEAIAVTQKNSGWYRRYYTVLNVIKLTMRDLIERGIDEISGTQLQDELMMKMCWSRRSASNCVTRARRYAILEVVGYGQHGTPIFKVEMPVDIVKQERERLNRHQDDIDALAQETERIEKKLKAAKDSNIIDFGEDDKEKTETRGAKEPDLRH